MDVNRQESLQLAADDLLGDDSELYVVVASAMAHPPKTLLDAQSTSSDQDSLGLLQNRPAGQCIVELISQQSSFEARASLKDRD